MDALNGPWSFVYGDDLESSFKQNGGYNTSVAQLDTNR